MPVHKHEISKIFLTVEIMHISIQLKSKMGFKFSFISQEIQVSKMTGHYGNNGKNIMVCIFMALLIYAIKYC